MRIGFFGFKALLMSAAMALVTGTQAYADEAVQNGKIAFTSGHERIGYTLDLMAADGSGRSSFLNPADEDSSAQWSPDGLKIAFIEKVGRAYTLYITNADGTGKDLVEPGVDPYGWAWSPDGESIAYSAERNGNTDIYVETIPGPAEARRITTNAAADFSPDWSPDGARIAFISKRDGDNDIYIKRVSSSIRESKFTFDSFYNGYPKWSPNGRGLAYVTIGNGASNIYTRSPSDQWAINLTLGQIDSVNEAEWSADGSTIIFGGFDDGWSQVYSVTTDGAGQPRKLSNGRSQDMRPKWSPDGSKIVFESIRDGSKDILIMDRDGSNETNLTRTANLDESMPNWQPLYPDDGGPDDPPDPPQPPDEPEKPQIKIMKRALARSRNIVVRLRCISLSQRRCKGRLTLRRPRSSRWLRRTVAGKGFNIKAGKTSRVRVPLYRSVVASNKQQDRRLVRRVRRISRSGGRMALKASATLLQTGTAQVQAEASKRIIVTRTLKGRVRN